MLDAVSASLERQRNDAVQVGGTPLQDIVTAAYVYEEARQHGAGREIDDYQSQSLKEVAP